MFGIKILITSQVLKKLHLSHQEENIRIHSIIALAEPIHYFYITPDLLKFYS